jgi:hypothetical protein
MVAPTKAANPGTEGATTTRSRGWAPGERFVGRRAELAAARDALDAHRLVTLVGPRLVREWLAAQAVSGYVTNDGEHGTFELPMEHALVLAVPESPAYVVGAVEIVAGQFTTLDRLEAALRGDGGIPHGAFPTSLHSGIERYFATAYRHQLADVWFPAVDGLVDRLAAGARVAARGCSPATTTSRSTRGSAPS